MRIHQYIHLAPDDTVVVKHCEEGVVRLAVTTETEPVYYLFLTAEQAGALHDSLDTPPAHPGP
jgi:hypothetical protein